MKKALKKLIIFLMIIATLSFLFYKKNNKIENILKTESYSYLGKEAKNYIKEAYKETGEVVLTEKNKKENEPYLNPRFINYLELSDEEKAKVEEIPRVYNLDYVETEERGETTYPTTFDLRNYNGKNYITKLKDQKTLDLCWSFTSLEQAESYLMIKNNTPYNSSSQLFSTRQLDYACSNNGITDYTNPEGTRDLAAGGNSISAYLVLVNGLGLVDENKMSFNTSNNKKELIDVLNYNNSLYEVNSAVIMPTIDEDTTDSERKSFTSAVKKLVMENGGAFVGTQGPGYTCSSQNTDGNYIIRVDASCNRNAGHAMQIIGWNDDYTYKYCKKNNAHDANTTNCSNIVTGQGAWILRNSWGSSNYPYVYLAYDSFDLDVAAITNMTSMQNKSWDNNYHNILNPFYYYYGSTDTLEVSKKINTPEKIEKVKFLTYSQNGTYRISIETSENSYTNIKQITTDYPGFYTVDLSDLNLTIPDSDYTIKVYSTNGKYLVKNSISVFTSNISDDYEIKSEKDKIELDASNQNYVFRLFSNTKNISSNSLINYSLLNKQKNNVSNYLTYSYNRVAYNNINTLINISSSIPKGTYTLIVSYGDKTEEIPIRIGDIEEIEIKFNSNDGSNKYIIQKELAETSIKLNSNSFIRVGYTFKEWNTSPDGTGTSYENEYEFEELDESLELYAQWIPIKYTINYYPNGGVGEVQTQTIEYGKSVKLKENIFTRNNYVFIGWNTARNGNGKSYSDKEEVINLSTEEGAVINIYAQWDEIRPYKINHYQVDYNEKYIDFVEINTTKETLGSYIEVDDGYSYEIEFGEKDIAYTGSKVKIYHDEELIAEFTIIVRGDVNGDGIINSADLLKIVKHLKDTSKLTGASKIAADCNKSNDINSADLLKIVKYLKGTGTL